MDLDLRYINDWAMTEENDIYIINGKQYQYNLEERKFVTNQ